MKRLMIIGLWPDDAVNYCTEKCDCRRYAFDRILYHRGGRAARERICIPVVDRSGATTTYLDLPVTLLEAGVVYLRLDDGSDIFLSNTQMALIANEVEEKNVHERAVKLRKMTDDKLVEHIDHIREEAYNTGYSEAEAQRASNPAPGKTLPQLLEQLDAGECKGIKSATAYKIAEFAREQGYLE